MPKFPPAKAAKASVPWGKDPAMLCRDSLTGRFQVRGSDFYSCAAGRHSGLLARSSQSKLRLQVAHPSCNVFASVPLLVLLRVWQAQGRSYSQQAERETGCAVAHRVIVHSAKPPTFCRIHRLSLHGNFCRSKAVYIDRTFGTCIVTRGATA